MRNTGLNHETLEALVSSVNFSKITHLDISLNYGLEELSAVSMIDKPFIRYLKSINLEKTNLTNEAIRIFSENPYLINLRILDISNNTGLEFKTLAEELEESKFLGTVTQLYIGGTGLTLEETEELNKTYKLNVFNTSSIVKILDDVEEQLRQDEEPLGPLPPPEPVEEGSEKEATA